MHTTVGSECFSVRFYGGLFVCLVSLWPVLGIADVADATVLGENSYALGPGSTAVGAVTNANGLQSTAVGFAALADQPQATALGSFAQAFGQAATAVGANAYVEAAGAVALGADTLVEAAQGTAIGYQSMVLPEASHGVALGNGSVATQANTVSVGDAEAGLSRRLTNVAAAEQALDAVNLQQMHDGLASVRTDTFAGIAAAAALEQRTPSQPGKTVVNLGAAGYRGEQAMALTFSHWLEGGQAATVVGGGVAYDSSQHLLGKVGVSWEF